MKNPLKNINPKKTAEFAAGTFLGFSLFWVFSHPKSFIKKKLPAKNVKNFHFFPNVKFHHKNKTYHIHHWAIFITFLPIFMVDKKIFRSKIVHGLVLGSIIQGITYRDRFNFIYSR